MENPGRGGEWAVLGNEGRLEGLGHVLKEQDLDTKRRRSLGAGDKGGRATMETGNPGHTNNTGGSKATSRTPLPPAAMRA